MTTSPTPIDPRHTALLVLDCQPAVLGAVSKADELLAQVQIALETIRRAGAQVGYVRIAFADADIKAIPTHSRMYRVAALAGDHLHDDAAVTAVHPHILPEPGDIVVRKTRIGAFATTDLDEQLRSRGITTLLLAGVSTSGAVLSTVRDAHDRDYNVYVLTDATADPQPHLHDFLTQHIFPPQADVISTNDLQVLFTGITDTPVQS